MRANTRLKYELDAKPILALTSSTGTSGSSIRILPAEEIATRFLYSIGVSPVARRNLA